MQELDLDFLESGRSGARATRDPTPEAEMSPDSMDLVKVVFLGAAAVGKTSIIQQFVWSEFSDEYMATEHAHSYYPSVILNQRLYGMKITDLPVIPYFPVCSFLEWGPDHRFYGLRSASLYVLVFDLSNTDTFHYIRRLREQISESRDLRSVPLLVVGNKQDLVLEDSAAASATEQQSTCSSDDQENHVGDGSGESTWPEVRGDIANLVEKHWNCCYVECSAKYNCSVAHVFKRLMRIVEEQQVEEYQQVCSSVIRTDVKDDFEKEMMCLIV